jgi:hypothetical protein
MVKWHWQEKPRYSGKNCSSASLSTINLTCDQTRAFGLRGRQLTAWAVARLKFICIITYSINLYLTVNGVNGLYCEDRTQYTSLMLNKYLGKMNGFWVLLKHHWALKGYPPPTSINISSPYKFGHPNNTIRSTRLKYSGSNSVSLLRKMNPQILTWRLRICNKDFKST